MCCGKMVGYNKLTLVELQTTVCEIKAILNDRKLTNIPTVIDGLVPLTPAHLLYGERLTIFPDDVITEGEVDDPSYEKNRQNCLQLTDEFKW